MKVNVNAITAVNNYELKPMCGFCGTELTEPDRITATGNPLWCPRCQCYPLSITVGMGSATAFVSPLVAISQEEYNCLKHGEQDIKRLKATLVKTKEAILPLKNRIAVKRALIIIDDALGGAGL